MKPNPNDDGETVDLLEISVRFFNRLEEYTGVVTCRDLMRLGQRTLRLMNLGDKCVDEIAGAFLERYGIELPETGDPRDLADIEPPFKTKLEASLHFSKRVAEEFAAKK